MKIGTYVGPRIAAATVRQRGMQASQDYSGRPKHPQKKKTKGPPACNLLQLHLILNQFELIECYKNRNLNRKNVNMENRFDWSASHSVGMM